MSPFVRQFPRRIPDQVMIQYIRSRVVTLPAKSIRDIHALGLAASVTSVHSALHFASIGRCCEACDHSCKFGVSEILIFVIFKLVVALSLLPCPRLLICVVALIQLQNLHNSPFLNGPGVLIPLVKLDKHLIKAGWTIIQQCKKGISMKCANGVEELNWEVIYLIVLGLTRCFLVAVYLMVLGLPGYFLVTINMHLYVILTNVMNVHLEL